MKIVVGSDHRGFEVKRRITTVLQQLGHEVQDIGPNSRDSVDYPDFAFQVGLAVSEGRAQRGVLVCGTGIGMSIAANKHAGIRAALVHTEFEARMARAHNDANVLCLGERVVGVGVAGSILAAFLDGVFEGGRHAKRVEMLKALDVGHA